MATDAVSLALYAGYELADAPVMFWTHAVVLGTCGALFLGCVPYGIGWLLRSMRERPQ